MNVTPSQNQPRTAPAFGAFEIDFNKIAPELREGTVKAIRTTVGQADKVILSELPKNSFVGFNLKANPQSKSAVTNKIIIAINSATEEL
ncbi:MAG: hypothetical protein WCG95_03490, partial [bacterium]